MENPIKKFKKSEIDRDFKDLNNIINDKVAAIELKYGNAIIFVKTDDGFNIGFIANQDYLLRE